MSGFEFGVECRHRALLDDECLRCSAEEGVNLPAPSGLREVLAAHRVSYHHRNVGPEPVTSANLRYTSCDGCEWLGGRRDEAGWEAHLEAAVLAWVEERLTGAREDVARALCESVNPGGHGWQEHRDEWRRDADAALGVIWQALGKGAGA